MVASGDLLFSAEGRVVFVLCLGLLMIIGGGKNKVIYEDPDNKGAISSAVEGASVHCLYLIFYHLVACFLCLFTDTLMNYFSSSCLLITRVSPCNAIT